MNRKRVITFLGIVALAAGMAVPLAVGGALSSVSSATTVPPTPSPIAQPERSTTVLGIVPNVVSGAITGPRRPVPPVRVEVAGADIAVDVQPVGIESDGSFQVPENVAIAGWYQYGSDPDSPRGTTVIAAHVDSNAYGLGPFARLKTLSVGQQIVVTSSNGSIHNYRVQSVDKVLKSDLPLDSVFDREGAPRLVLITCGGQFNYDTGHYNDNVVVTALPATP